MRRLLLALLLAIPALASAQEGPPRRVRPFNIPSASMLPTLEIGDYVLTDLTDGAMPQRGDIVVFRPPSDPSIDYVKRVVAIPGDRVAIREGRLVLNGSPIPRADKGDSVIDQGDFTETVHRYIETLPGGRAYAIVKRTDQGAMNNTEETTVPPHTFYVLGDNRDNSVDSRADNVKGYQWLGPIPLGNLVSTVHSIYWSRNRARVGQTVE